MENHVHLLLETPEPTLGKGMRELHGTYAQIFNARHGRVGHVFHEWGRLKGSDPFVVTERGFA
jgi:REP element-mobilizing transposase RayT